MTRSFDLPYFDQLLAKLDREPASALATAFRRHVHWGYFATPEGADDSMEGYVVAAEAMTRRMCDHGRVGKGQRILDVGCGFGGTVAYLNEHLSNVDLVGVNINPRQIERARKLVRPEGENRVEFVVGDACAMPFAEGRFDTILAVECIFHFPSRKQFFREVARLLAPKGTMVLSDFIVPEDGVDALASWMASDAVPSSRFYGQSGWLPPTPSLYERLARANRLAVAVDDDITANTLPTYPAMRRLYREAGIEDGVVATNYLEAAAQKGLLQYRILSFSHR